MRRHTDYYVVVEDDEQDDDDKIMLCENCSKVGVQSILKPRIYFKEENGSGKQVVREPDHDADQWRQCRICWSVVKVSETRVESELSDVVEVDDSNIKEEIIPLFDKKRKGRLAKYREEHTSDSIKDPDVLKAMKQGKRVENYSEIIPE